MIQINHIRFAVTGAVAACLMATPGWALSSRSWVSAYGSDLNPCSRSLPCRTLQHAHDLTANGGEVDAVDPADYGALTINRSITIDGANVAYIEIHPLSTGVSAGILINAAANLRISPTVVIRNLSIAGPVEGPALSVGISWTAGQSLFIENVSIDGVETGILSALPVSSTDFPRPQLFVKDSSIHNATVRGIGILGPIVNGFQTATNVTAVIDHVAIDNAVSGIALQTGSANVNRSTIAHANIAIGVSTGSNLGPGGDLSLSNSSISYSKFGVFCTFAGNTVRMGGNDLHNNDTALFANGGQIISFGDNRILGNVSGETPSSTVTLK